jgi:orotate phosphoribosyltransferase
MGAVTPAGDAAVAARTEALFRRAGALREGHFRLKSGRHSDRYLEKFQVLQYPEITSELCAMLASFGRVAEGVPARTSGSGPALLTAQEALAAALHRAYPVKRRVPAGEDLAAATILAALPRDWRLAPAPTAATAPAAVDVVAGPTTGGVILAFETARQLGVRSLFAEEVRDASGAHREFRRGFTLRPGERVLLVDDILTTGGSLAAMLPAVERFGATVVRAVVLVDRSGGQETIASPASGRTYPLSALWRLELPTWEAGDACPGCRASLPLEEPGSGGAGGEQPPA